MIELTAVDNNPYWRGGLLVLLRIPKSELKIEGAAPIETINFCDWYYGVTPMFGGWCDDQDELVFVSFYPNMLNGLADLEDYILRWARNRIWYADLLVGEAREMESSPSS